MSSLQNVKLLLVENDPIQITIFQRRLKNQVRLLEIATNKQDALNLLKAHFFHVALLAIKLDGDEESENQDGMDLAAYINASADPTGVIMLTAFGTVARTRDAILQHGAIDFLEKSNYTKEILLAAVDKAAQKAFSSFHDTYRASLTATSFISKSNFQQLKAETRYELVDNFEGLLKDLLEPLIPLGTTQQNNEELGFSDSDIYFKSRYWSRMEGKGTRVMAGTHHMLRPLIEDDQNKTGFVRRSRHSITGYRYFDEGLAVDDFA